jgi:hypothetical protein
MHSDCFNASDAFDCLSISGAPVLYHFNHASLLKPLIIQNIITPLVCPMLRIFTEQMIYFDSRYIRNRNRNRNRSRSRKRKRDCDYGETMDQAEGE